MLTLRSVGPAAADGPANLSPIAPLLVDRREAARLLSLSERTIFTLTKSGQLPSKRIGRNVRYSLGDLVAWLSQTTSAATTTV
jgi:excisionase family DNA binding protein